MDFGDTEPIHDSGGLDRTLIDPDRMKPLVNADSASEISENDETEDVAETVSIPTLNLFGILVLIILLGVCLARIGRARS